MRRLHTGVKNVVASDPPVQRKWRRAPATGAARWDAGPRRVGFGLLFRSWTVTPDLARDEWAEPALREPWCGSRGCRRQG